MLDAIKDCEDDIDKTAQSEHFGRVEEDRKQDDEHRKKCKLAQVINKQLRILKLSAF
jgi:hypothetical protein